MSAAVEVPDLVLPPARPDEPTRESVARMLREAGEAAFAAALENGDDAGAVADRAAGFVDRSVWLALRDLARIEAEAPTTPPPSSQRTTGDAWTQALLAISDAGARIEAEARALREAGHHADAAALSVLAASVRGATAGALRGRELAADEGEGMGGAAAGLLADWRRQ